MKTPAAFSIIKMPDDINKVPRPTNGPYYVISRKGIFAVTNNHFGTTLTPIEEIPTLNEAPIYFWHNVPRIPATLIEQAWSFFRAIWERDGSEAMVDITWGPEPHGYRLFVMPQQATSGGVQARRDLTQYRSQIVGTIHSHSNFGAFHSGTDQHDADGHDGLHITIGNVDRKDTLPSFAVMFARAKNHWDKLFTIEDVIEGEIRIEGLSHPEWWEKFVDQKLYQSKMGTKSSTPSGLMIWNKDDDRIWQPGNHYPQYKPGVVMRQPPPRQDAPNGYYKNLTQLVLENQNSIPTDEYFVLADINEQLEELLWALENFGIKTIIGMRLNPESRDTKVIEAAITSWEPNKWSTTSD